MEWQVAYRKAQYVQCNVLQQELKNDAMIIFTRLKSERLSDDRCLWKDKVGQFERWGLEI